MNSFVNVQVRILAAQAQRQLDQINDRIAGLEGSFGRANRGARTFGDSLSGMRLDSFGSRIQWIGRQLEYNFTLPILAAAAASFKLALDNEAAFTRVVKVYGDAERGAQFYAAEIKALEKNFKALSSAYGVNQKETIEIAAQWAAAGASGLALAKSVDLTMQTMILGELKAAEATEALIAIQAQYGFSVGELTKTIAILNMVENQTGISLGGLVQGFSRAAGVARSAGVDVRHLAAMLAALTPAAGSAAQAGNALKTIFSRLLSPTKETTEVLELMGIRISDMGWKSANVTDRLMLLSRTFEDLSDAQKNVVSSVIASRWQINKFEILMRELTNTNGYYHKALRTTADATQVFTQMQKELNTVLSSNPRRLQIIWTMLQNASADVIQPMIPLLLYLASVLQQLTTWFSELHPAVQKLVITLLFLLAAIGPLVRLGGAVILLVAELTNLFRFLVLPIVAATGALWTFIGVPIIKFLTVVGAGLRAFILSFAALGPMMARAMLAVQAALIMGATWMGIAFRAGLDAIMVLMAGFTATMVRLWPSLMIAIEGAILAGAAFAGRAWRGMLFLMAAITIKWRSTMLAIFAGIIPMLRAFSTAAIAALTGPWGIAIAIVVALVLAFWDELKAIWIALVRGTIQAFNTLPAGIRNAMMAVINVVRAAVMKVYELFSYLNPWARHSPSLVDNVRTGVEEIKRQYGLLRGITDVLRDAGMGLEDFAKATEKVKAAAEAREIAELRKELAGIAPDVLPEFDKLVKLLAPLRAHLRDLNVVVKAQEAITAQWKQNLDEVNFELEAQEMILRGLEEVADDLRSQLTDAQSELERFANAPIAGMREMADAIFENEMAQKALRLEMLNIEDAVGGFDQLQDRINAINGELELLTGEQKALRDAGAGSDILSEYDEQISLLEQQKDAIMQQVAPLEELASQIDELGRQAERLDLEESLAFDPLARQIDQLSSSMIELPFEEILAGVVSNRHEVDRLTAAYDQAALAVEQQRTVVDQLTAQRDAISATYDLEAAKLKMLQDEYGETESAIREIEQALRDVGQAARSASGGGGMSPGAENFLASAGGNFPDVGGMAEIGREGGFEDQSKLIDDFTKEMADKTKNMFGLFNFMDPIKKGWNSAVNWLKENIGPAFAAVGESIGSAFGSFGDPFGGMGSWLDTVKSIGKGIVDAFKLIWEVIGPEVIEFGKEAWEGLKDAFKEIQPEIEKFRELVGPMGEALGNVWAVLKPILTVVLGLILMIAKALISALAGAIGPVIRAIGALISGIVQILRGIIEVIVGVFTGDWEMAWQGVKDIFMGIINGIWGLLKNLVLAIWGLIKGLVMGIVDFFVWLWDKLVGHSVVVDIVEDIIHWFTILRDGVMAVINAVVAIVRWAFENIIKPIFEAWKTALNLLRAVFSSVFEWVKNAWNDFINKVRWAWEQINYFFNLIKAVWNTLVGVFAGAVNGVKGWIDNLVSAFNNLRNRFSFWGMFDGIKDAFKSAINWIIGKWNNMSFGVGPFKAETPNLPFLARGGMIASQAMAIVGEGRSGFPEYVIPTDPIYRNRALELFAALAQQLGVRDILKNKVLNGALQASSARGGAIRLMASGGLLGGSTVKRGLRSGGALVLAPNNSHSEYHFHGDLSFPNIKSSSDAEEFLRNLESLVGEE